MAFHKGKGTCQVAMPKVLAMGWNSQIFGNGLQDDQINWQGRLMVESFTVT